MAYSIPALDWAFNWASMSATESKILSSCKNHPFKLPLSIIREKS